MPNCINSSTQHNKRRASERGKGINCKLHFFLLLKRERERKKEKSKKNFTHINTTATAATTINARGGVRYVLTGNRKKCEAAVLAEVEVKELLRLFEDP
jgi:hypothetical protein